MKTTLTRYAALCALTLAACSVEGDPTKDQQGCDGGKCDGFDEDEENVRETPCDGTLVDESGRGLGNGKIAGRVNDALARLAFGEGESCPTSFTDTINKLKDEGCTSHETMFVSETAQILEQETSYRAVTTLECDIDGQESRVWFSAFGISGTEGPIPQSVEMIAFDPVDGVFNYYESKGNRIDFFGTSEDFVAEGTGNGAERRCAACHTGGGLIMKELAAPWLHWEPDFDTPGTNALVDNNREEFGNLSDGIVLEDLVREGNREWNQKRVENRVAALGEGASTAELLRPLFCTVEVNLDSRFGPDASSGNLGGAVTDASLAFGSINFTNEQYQAVLEENNSRVAGLPGDTRRDTLGALAHISRGAADVDYQERLRSEGVVSREFVEDVLLVDFTRSIFSEDRCGLLEFAPELSSENATAQNIAAGFIENLEAASPEEGTPAADLLRNLQNEEDDASATVQKFHTTCRNREDRRDANADTVPGRLADYMKIVSHNREQATRLAVFEFPQTMPTDDLSHPDGQRLDPRSCEIITEYVSVTPEEGPPPVEFSDECTADRCGEFVDEADCQCDEECVEAEDCCDNFEAVCENISGGGSCEGRCGEFTNGATCQCDEACQEFGNCCDDFEAVCENNPDSCLGRCGEFTDGANCQCDEACEQFGNCCDDRPAVCGDDGGGTSGEGPAPDGGECCRTCVTSQACGDACIGANLTCSQEPGCACQG